MSHWASQPGTAAGSDAGSVTVTATLRSAASPLAGSSWWKTTGSPTGVAPPGSAGGGAALGVTVTRTAVSLACGGRVAVVLPSAEATTPLCGGISPAPAPASETMENVVLCEPETISAVPSAERAEARLRQMPSSPRLTTPRPGVALSRSPSSEARSISMRTGEARLAPAPLDSTLRR